MRTAIADEKDHLDEVLFTGHSLGGALAQVACLNAYLDSLADRPLAAVHDKLKCVTLAGPHPFAKKDYASDDARLSQAQKSKQAAALAWMAANCLNVCNNDDLVPRLPGVFSYVVDALKRAPRVGLMVGPYRAANLDIAKILAGLQDGLGLQRFETTSATVFVGHAEKPGGNRLPPREAHLRLKEHRGTDPLHEGVKNYMSGQVLSKVADHSVLIYVDRVYKTLSAEDGIFGHDVFITVGAVQEMSMPVNNGGGCYDGQVQAGSPHGKGIRVFGSGACYQGEWKADNFHGEGVMTYTDRMRYEGQWKAGQRHGLAVTTDADGKSYVGEWKADAPHNGKAVYKYPDGRVYAGEWQDGFKVKGVTKFPDGSRYEGEFQAGTMHGTGVFTWPDGQRYEGDFQADKMHGMGVLTLPDGRSYEGEFQRGRYDGEGVMTWSDGGRYEGHWKAGDYHGRGVMTYKDGERYDGQWQLNEMHKGVLTFPSGNRYEGEFQANKFHGKGVLTLASGEVQNGEFKAGKFIG